MTKGTWRVGRQLSWYTVTLSENCVVLIGKGPEGKRVAGQTAEWLNHYRHFNS